MDLTPNLTGPIGPLPENVPWATLYDLPGRHSSYSPTFSFNRTSLQLAAGGSICFVGAAGHTCISNGRLDATAGGFLPSEQGINHGSRATDPRLYAECFDRTVSRTGAALHAGIAVCNFNLSIGLTQDRVGTDQKTGATSYAFLSIKSQRDNILQIDQLTRHIELLIQRIAIQSRE